jgi:hypothetical protein
VPDPSLEIISRPVRSDLKADRMLNIRRPQLIASSKGLLDPPSPLGILKSRISHLASRISIVALAAIFAINLEK